jgi:hypothetical protein
VALCPAIAAIGLLTTLAFQVADIYQVEAFRGHEKQYFRLATAWSVVFLLVIGASFFAKVRRPILARLARQLSYRRPRRCLLPPALFLLVRRWTREGHSSAAP